MEKYITSSNLLPICIYEILYKHSDIDHKLTRKAIGQYLCDEYNLYQTDKDGKTKYDKNGKIKLIHRNTVGNIIERLKEELGVDIKETRGSDPGAWMDSRPFSDAQLQLLIDNVFSGRYISSEESLELIERLSGLGSDFFQEKIKYTYNVEGLGKNNKTSVLENIDAINNAVKKARQIHVTYNKYGSDKQLHKSSEMELSPYRIMMHGGRFYVLAHNEKYKTIGYYKVDRMSEISILDASVTPLRSIPGFEDGLNNKKLAVNLPYMFADPQQPITFSVPESVIDQIFDWFGEDMFIMNMQNDLRKGVLMTVRTSPTAMKYFALQYLNSIEVIKPESLRQEIKEALEKGIGKYK